MKTIIQSYIGSKAPSERSKSEVQSLVPWFRKHGKGILKDVTDEMFIDILLSCFLKLYQKDEIIIIQGDIGDKFYIVVYGEINVYVNDNGNPATERLSRHNSSLWNKELLNFLGKCVASEGAGYTFGEYALLDENSIRKASVIATKETMLVVIPKEINNQCLKNIQQSMFEERKQFVNNNSLFGEWNPKLKAMLMMSLKKITIPYQSNLVTQGEEWQGIHFITKGSGKLTIDPNKHEQQFPRFYPIDLKSWDQRYWEFPELQPHVSTKHLGAGSYVEKLMPKHIQLKRAGNYAALETHFLNHKHFLCSVQPGEIVGDLEFMFNLHQNLCSIVCTEEIEAFILDLTIIERLLKRLTFDEIHEKLKTIIQSKMEHREKYFKDMPVPLLMLFKLNLYDKKVANIPLLPELKTKKKLPDDDLEWQHLLKMFQDGKAALCRPCVKGGIFLKDLMKSNADYRRSAMVTNPEMLNEIEVQNSTDVIDSKFPISQDRIYQLQKKVPNSLMLLEVMYNEIENFKLEQKMKVKKTDRNQGSRRGSTGRILMDEKTSSKNEIIQKGKLSFNDSSNALDPKSVVKDRFKNAYLKYKSKISKDILTSNESLKLLQSSEIKFLNSLCSEKSSYAVKKDHIPNPNREKKKTHFLPILRSSNDIQTDIIPKKGAKVLVKRHRCIALDTSYSLLNHVHDRFQMVDKLEWENVEKLQDYVSEFLKTKYKKNLSE